MATTYSFPESGFDSGDVVVKKAEIDFFNVCECFYPGRETVERYKWTFTHGVLHLTPVGCKYLCSSHVWRA
jgi:hypothetical protein